MWCSLENEDLPKIKYINYSYWNELSDYTGSPIIAAKTILSGKTVYDVPNDGFWKAADYIKSGNTFPPLITLTDNDEYEYMLIEGHQRVTAYALAPEYFNNISVLCGYCSTNDIRKWYDTSKDS